MGFCFKVLKKSGGEEIEDKKGDKEKDNEGKRERKRNK